MQPLDRKRISSDIGVSLRADAWTGRISPGALPPLEDRPQGLRGGGGGLGWPKRAGLAAEGRCTAIFGICRKLHFVGVVYCDWFWKCRSVDGKQGSRPTEW